MRLGFVFVGLPNPLSGGGALTAYNTIKYLKQKGNEIIAIILLESLNLSENDQKKADGLKEICDKLYFLERPQNKFSAVEKIKNKLFPSLRALYPEVGLKDKVKEIFNQEKSEAIFMYEFQPIAACLGINNIPKMQVAGDPPFEVLKYRYLYAFYESNWKTWALWPLFPWLYFQLKNKDIKLIKSADAAGAYAAHHAKELQDYSGKQVKYYRTPMEDPFKGNEQELWDMIGKKNDKFTIALLGHLKGISTLAGAYMFADKILPVLNEKLGRNNFEVVIVGRYFNDLPKKWQEKLKDGPVKIIEFVDNLEKVMSQSDVFLVPTPIKLGIRVRIITALSYGSFIVTHKANQYGIPELKDGYNCLIGDSAQELVDKIIACCNKKYDSSYMRKQARKTFRDYFEVSKAVGLVEKDLLDLVNRV